jgi:minor histocompatibility antigen H13
MTERMSSDDAWLFPIVRVHFVGQIHMAEYISLQIGSVALVGLYTIVKYFGEKWINWLLGWYFSIAGVGSVWNVSNAVKSFCALCGAEKILKLFPLALRSVGE